VSLKRVIIPVLALLFCSYGGAQTSPLQPAGAVELPGVTGRIDHLAFEPATGRLFVAALGHDTVEIVDTAKRTHLRSLRGFHEPQGITEVPDADGIAVANGGTGTLQLIDAKSLSVRWTTEIGGDADNVRYDTQRKRVIVAAEGGLYAVDPAAGKVAARISIAGHPESFQLEAGGSRVYANLPGASKIVAGDRSSWSVDARWATGSCGSNYPMALDEDAARLFVGCRRPASVIVVDDRTGAILGTTATVGDTDDMFYDATRRRVYVIGGEGAIDVLSREGDSLRSMARIPTRAGARTGLWVAAQNRLYVAVPARNGQAAEILVFDAR
jgi:DNA-binding beta-propeller fold protein YncE